MDICADVYRATFPLLAGVNLVNLLFAAKVGTNYTPDTSHCSVRIAVGLSAAKTIILDLVRQMKAAVE